MNNTTGVSTSSLTSIIRTTLSALTESTTETSSISANATLQESDGSVASTVTSSINNTLSTIASTSTTSAQESMDSTSIAALCFSAILILLTLLHITLYLVAGGRDRVRRYICFRPLLQYCDRMMEYGGDDDTTSESGSGIFAGFSVQNVPSLPPGLPPLPPPLIPPPYSSQEGLNNTFLGNGAPPPYSSQEGLNNISLGNGAPPPYSSQEGLNNTFLGNGAPPPYSPTEGGLDSVMMSVFVSESQSRPEEESAGIADTSL